MEKVQLRARFKGNVQGVFFRQHAKRYAEKYDICGYVKNLEDGSVEILAVSDKASLDKFMEEIQTKPGFGSISSVEKKYSKEIEGFSDFQISY